MPPLAGYRHAEYFERGERLSPLISKYVALCASILQYISIKQGNDIMDKKLQGLSENDAEIWNLYISNLKNSNDPIPYQHIYEHGSISRRLDLHGMTIHDAWLSLVEFTECHRMLDTKEIVVITGRSGKIAHEFTEWCRRLAHVRSYEPIETRGGKVGSYRLRLR